MHVAKKVNVRRTAAKATVFDEVVLEPGFQFVPVSYDGKLVENKQ